MHIIVEQGSNWEKWTAIGTLVLAFFTLLAVGVAVFQDRIKSRIWHPTLALHILPQPPDCLKITTTWSTRFGSVMQSDSYYLRVQVENVGHTAADMVEVYLADILELNQKGDFEPRKAFLPMNLEWSNFEKPPILLDHLSPHMPKHCGLAHIVDPKNRTSMPREDNPSANLKPKQTALSLELVVKPNSGSHLLPPGTYRLKLVLGAANAITVTTWVEIVLNGQWFDDENEMLSKGLIVQHLNEAESARAERISCR